MLSDFMVGNTPETIYECLCCLHREYQNQCHSQYKVSIVYGSGRLQVRVGDDLELADPNTCKVRKKRWWERYEEAKDQLKFPFSLYQPANIVYVHRYSSDNSFELQIEFKNTTSYRVITDFNPADGLQGNGRSIKAIKIHRIEEDQTDPFVPTSQPSQERSQPVPCAPATWWVPSPVSEQRCTATQHGGWAAVRNAYSR